LKRRNINHLPALAGLRALLLLANEAPAAYDQLLPEVWRRWMPAILRLDFLDGWQGHRVLATRACRLAPREAADWASRVIDLENKEVESLSVLRKLPEQWDQSLGKRC